MPTANFKRIDLDLVYPPFLERVLDTVAACNDRGVRYIATHGYRTYGEQMALWAKGRTVAGPRVTNAKGGQSAHNFGLAIDFVRDLDVKKPGVQPGWSEEDFAVLIEEATKRGLHSGKGYKDFPHIAWPCMTTSIELLPLHLAWEKSADVSISTLERLRVVWKEVK